MSGAPTRAGFDAVVVAPTGGKSPVVNALGGV